MPKRKKALAAAASEHGADFVRKLESMRDPKERILFAAEAIFAQRGFGGARTQQIADLASVNKAMIHYYFDSKEGLFHAVLDQLLFDLIKLTQETVRRDLPPAELLEVFLQGFFDYVAEHKNFSRLTAMTLGTSDRYLARMVETFFKPIFDRGVEFIERGTSAGAFRQVDARHAVVSIYGMMISYFSDAEFVEMLLGEDPLTERMIAQRREALIDTVFAMLGCKRP